MAQKLVVRAATLADYGAVMNINRNVYEGFDYLPVYYQIYLQSPDCHSFLCELNGKVVGFAVLRVIDGGLTVVSVAGRVDPSLNRMGIFGKLTNPAVDEVKRRVPSLQFYSHAGIGAKHFDKLQKEVRRGEALERIVLKWNLLLFKGNPGDLCSFKSGLASLTQDAVVLGIDTAKTVFSDTTNIVCLFPTGYLICYNIWWPLRASYDVMIDVVKSHFTLVTFREGSSHKLLAASFSFALKIAMGIRVDIFYHGITPCTNLLRQHVIKHVEHATSITGHESSMIIFVHFPLGHDVEGTKQSLKSFLGDSFLTKTYSQENAVVAEGPIGPPVKGHIAKL